MFRKAASALLLAGLCAAAAMADAPPAAPADATAGAAGSAREAVIARSAAVSAEIRLLAEKPSPGGAARLRRLQRLERMLDRHLEQLRRAEELAAQQAGLEATRGLAMEKKVAGKPPFRVSDYDAALAAQTEAEQVQEGLEGAAADASSSLEEARRLIEKRQGLQDELEAAPAAGEGAADDPSRLAERRATAALLLEIAERNLDQRRQKLANAREAVNLQRELIAERARQADWIAERVAVDQRELDDALARLEAQEDKLEQRRERAEVELAAAQKRSDAFARSTGEIPELDPVQQAERAALGTELTARQKEISLLGELIDRIERTRVTTQRRFTVLGGHASRSDVRDWLDDSLRAVDSTSREVRLSQAELQALVQELALIETELQPQEPEAPYHRRQLPALRGSIALTQEVLDAQKQDLLRENRLIVGAERALGGRSLARRAHELLDTAQDVWSYEVTRTEDRSITVGRIASAIVAFLLGMLVARLLSYGLASRVLRRLGVDEGAASAYQSLFYYGFVAFAFLLALRSVDIPLTAFAIAGGALAIGVGFGSQNIIKNFISGLILLAERPIKKGDVILVDGTQGTVERIGLRSTRVRTGQNIHVIVPNSTFLESNVTNWTHTDSEVGMKLGVAVAHGTPPREIEKLLHRALAEQPGILARPAPSVLFTGFGENALQFEAHFRVNIRGSVSNVESELRYRVDDLFREYGVAWAHPQRDVHFDAAAPIPVRLVDGDEERKR